MRELFKLFAFAAAVFASGCSDSGSSETPSKPTLSVVPAELTFPSEGGTGTLTVGASGIRWRAEPQANWLTVSAAGVAEGDGTLTVTAAPNIDPGVRKGGILLSGPGVEDVAVSVTQQGAVTPEPEAFIWERSSAYRMNLNGPVESAGLYGSYADDTFIGNLRFDSEGRLTEYTVDDGTGFRVYYDDAGRLRRVARARDEASIEFSYGSHGLYVPVEEILNEIQIDYMVVDFNVWLPRFILGAEKITAGGSAYTFSAAGSEATVTRGTEEFGKITYEGVFPSSMTFSGAFGNSSVEYSFDAETGNLLVYTISDAWGGVVRTYNNDRLNTLARTEGDMPMEITYNDNLDMAAVSYPDYPSDNRSMEYVYDAQGNWVKMNVTSGTGDTEEITREITYR